MLKFIKKIIKTFKRNKNYYSPLQYEKMPLPPWEEIVEMCYDKQLSCYDDTIEKVIYSKLKDLRAIIFKTSTNIYTVSYEKLYPWDEENEYEMEYFWSGGLPGYWGGFSTSAIATNSFYDSLEIAEKEISSMPEFSGGDCEKNSLPPWEEIIEMCYGQGLSNLSEYTIEKVIYTKPKDFRAVIYKKRDMYFIICERLFAWDEEDEYEINEYLSGKGLPGYWFPIDNGASVFDSLETAEREIFSMPQFQT